MAKTVNHSVALSTVCSEDSASRSATFEFYPSSHCSQRTPLRDCEWLEEPVITRKQNTNPPERSIPLWGSQQNAHQLPATTGQDLWKQRWNSPCKVFCMCCVVFLIIKSWPTYLQPHGLQPSRLHFLLQGIFPSQGLNLALLHYRQILGKSIREVHKVFPSANLATSCSSSSNGKLGQKENLNCNTSPTKLARSPGTSIAPTLGCNGLLSVITTTTPISYNHHLWAILRRQDLSWGQPSRRWQLQAMSCLHSLLLGSKTPMGKRMEQLKSTPP